MVDILTHKILRKSFILLIQIWIVALDVLWTKDDNLVLGARSAETIE